MAKPNQKKSPLTNDVVFALEEAAKEVVENKFGRRRDLCTIKSSVLTGRCSDSYSVKVRANSFLMNLSDPVSTDIGNGVISTAYPSREGWVTVSVEFNVDDVADYNPSQ